MGKTLVYTALFGRHRVAYPPHGRDREADCLCFSDRPPEALKAPGWTVRRLAPWCNSLAMVKLLKCLPGTLGDYERSVWIDADLRPRRSLLEYFERMGAAELLCCAHQRRTTAAEEYAHCLAAGRDGRERLALTAARVMPGAEPLLLGGLLWRRHTPRVADFGQRWLAEMFLGSSRDQISLPWALLAAGVPYSVLPRGRFSRLVMQHKHR